MKRQVRKVLVLEPSGNLWGSELVLLDFLGNIPGLEWEVAVCCPPATPILEELARLCCPVYPLFLKDLQMRSKLARLRALAGLVRAAIDFGAELIYVNQAGTTRIAIWAGRILRVPVVTHVRLAEDVEYLSGLNPSPERVPGTICVSDHIFQMFRKDHPGLAVVYDPYRPRLQWGVAGCQSLTTPRFTCVGRLEWKKGQDLFLQAVGLLKRDGNAMAGTVVGSSSVLEPHFESILERMILEMGIGDQVEMTGHLTQQEVFRTLSSSTALVCPSWQESLGRVIFEAWDAGIVPIAWEGSGGPAEVIAASGGGVLYPRQDGETLAQTLKKVAQLCETERGALVQRGRNWLKNNCDPSVNTTRILELWKNSLSTQ